ncbi:glucose dehydrogenase [Pseudoroseicyclus sp. H15]
MFLLGWAITAFGILLLIGGVWLIALGGSYYHAPAGLALIWAGTLVRTGRIGAVWAVTAIWLVSFFWAWWEIGPDLTAQMNRLVAPSTILLCVLLISPALGRHPGAPA